MKLRLIYKKLKNQNWFGEDIKTSVADPFTFEPQILLNNELKLALLWSAKSACTFSIKWFFNHLNLLDAAQYYHPWIHHYRIQVYYASHGYKKAMKAFKEEPSSFKVVKIVRNPFSRAVSSFFGIPKRYYFNDYFPYEIKKIEKFLHRKLPSKYGETLSFSEFIQYLEQVDISNVDIHWREQLHPLERKGIVKPKIIKIENSHNELKEFEKSNGLNITDLSKITHSNHHLKRDTMNLEFWGEKRIKYQHNFKYPEYMNFYNESLKNQVFNIYEKDFIAYGYSSNLGNER